MPRQRLLGSLHRWKTNLSDFADLAIRIPPLFVLQWYSQNDFSILLKDEILSEHREGLLHCLLVVLLHMTAFSAFIWNPRWLLGLYSVTSTIYYLSLPWLEPSAQSAVGSTSIEGAEATLDLQAVYASSIKASFRVFLLVFAAISAGRLLRVPFRSSTTVLSPSYLLTFGPPISTLLRSIIQEQYFPAWVAVVLSAIAVILFRNGVTDLAALERFILHFQQDARTYCDHTRRTLPLVQRLRVRQIFSLFFVCRMIELVPRIIARAYSSPERLSWIALDEFRLSLDTTVSLMGLACVSIMGIKYVMSRVRDWLQLRGAGDGLKDELFLISFFLTIFADAPLSEPQVGLDCLLRFLALYVFSWLKCMHQAIDWKVHSMAARALAELPREEALRVILGSWLTGILTLVVYIPSWDDSRTPIVGGRFLFWEINAKLALTLFTLILLIINDGQAGVWRNYEWCMRNARILRFQLSQSSHLLFMAECMSAPCLLEPEVFFGIGVRNFTDGIVESQENFSRRRDSRRRKKAASRIRFQEVILDELAGDDTQCPICLGEMEAAIMTDCAHMFHEECLQSWLPLQICCPICRYPLDRNPYLDGDF